MNFADGHKSSDAALIGEIALGRQSALKLIMGRYMTMAFRTSYRILCDLNDSEEVTQKVFLHVWKNASGYDFQYSVSIWIYRILVRLCHERLRKRRLMDLFSSGPAVYEASAPAALSPEEDFITKETWAIFCRASSVLSPKHRTVFVLKDLEGLSTEDIVSITGMTSGQIKSHLDLARKRIIEELERYGKVR